MSLMRHHDPAKEETGRGEEVQLHQSDQMVNLHTAIWPEKSSSWDIMRKLNLYPHSLINNYKEKNTKRSQCQETWADM